MAIEQGNCHTRGFRGTTLRYVNLVGSKWNIHVGRGILLRKSQELIWGRAMGIKGGTKVSISPVKVRYLNDLEGHDRSLQTF
jgi:hypothetical protein